MARQGLDTGIGILVNSRLEVRNAGYTRFSARVGVDDSGWGASGPVTFSVYGDGHLLARSRPMRHGEPSQPLVADIAGVRIVEPVARARNRADLPDPVVWGEAALEK